MKDDQLARQVAICGVRGCH